MTRVLFIVSSVATANKHTLEKWNAQPAYASRTLEHASYVKNGRFDMPAAAEYAIFEQHALDLMWIANVTT